MSIINTVTAQSNNETTKSALVSEYIRAKTPLGSTPSSISTITTQENSTGSDVTTILTLTNFVIGAIPAANAALGVGAIVYTFPAGQHLELVYGFSNLSLTLPGTANAAAITGLGSVVASGAVSVLSGTATFQNRLTGQTLATASSGGAVASALLGATAGIGTGISLNVAANVKDVFLNCAATWVTANAGNLTASGVIVLKWVKMNA